MVGLATLPLLLLASARPTLDVGVRAEARVRSPPEGELALQAADAQLEPRVALGLSPGLWQLQATYAPRLTATQTVGLGRRQVVLHQGALRAGLQLGAGWGVQAEQRGSFGLNDPSRVVPAAGAPVGGERPLDPVGGLTPFLYLSLDSQLRVQGPLGPRTRVSAWAAYQREGAVDRGDAQAQAQLPLRQRAEGRAEALVDLGRRDVLGLQGGASVMELAAGEAAGRRGAVAELRGDWQHALSRTTRLRLGAGAGGAVARGGRDATGAPLPTEVRVLPLVGGELAHVEEGRDGRLELRALARHAPYVDRITGLVSGRVEGEARGSWALPSVRFDLRASGAYTVGQGPRTDLAAVELSTTWRLGPMMGLVGGVRSSWQQRALAIGELPGTRLEHGAFVAVTVQRDGLVL